LTVEILVAFFVLSRATLFLLALLSALLASLARLTGLVALTLLAGVLLTRLPSGLSTLLAVFLHIVCHE
jgi:hypothetical protein